MRVLALLLVPALIGWSMWVIGSAASAILLRLRSRREARTALARLEFDAGPSGRELLRGELVATGGAIGVTTKGRKTIVLAEEFGALGTNALTERVVASTGLAVRTAEGVVALGRDIDLVVGSRISWVRAVTRGGYQATCTLDEGDEVVVAAPPNPSAYRDGAPRLPLPSDAAVRVASAAPPVVRGGRTAIGVRAVAVLVGLLSLVPTVKYINAYVTVAESCSEGCRVDGRCEVHVELKSKGIVSGDVFSCAAGADLDCLASERCATMGECTARSGGCVAATDRDCAYTRGCVEYGQCTATEGRCALRRAEDCPRAECVGNGQCSLVEGEGRCAALSDRDCAETLPCVAEGRCTAMDGSCVRGAVSSSGDCAGTSECLVSGRCIDGVRLRDGMVCLAGDDGDCRESEDCAARKHCRLDPRYPVCTAQPVSCSASDACRVHGRCAEDEQGCFAASDADCARSERCAAGGACKKVGRECAKDPASTTQCRVFGRCELGKEVYLTATVPGCKASAACRERGECTLDDGRCVVGDDSDCASTPACASLGQCSAREGRCVAAGASDCLRAQVCSTFGQCSLGPSGCVAARDADCAGSLACRAGACFAENGACTRPWDARRCGEACTHLGLCAFEGYQCVAASDAGCQQSEVCKERGWCAVEADPSPHVRPYCTVPPT